MRVNVLRLCILSILLIVSSYGCGRKAPPELPELRAPEPVQELKVRGSLDGVVFSFEAPSKNAKGELLANLEGYSLERRVLEADSRASFKRVEKLLLNAEQKKLIASGSKEPIKHQITDEKVEAGVSYEYIVLAVNESGVKGEADFIIQVNFVGENSLVQLNPVARLY